MSETESKVTPLRFGYNQITTDAEYVQIKFPKWLSVDGATHVESLLILPIKGMKRRAMQTESEDNDER